MEKLLLSLFNIRRQEYEKTFLMALYAFNALAAFIIGRITKDTLFLTHSEGANLPYMYIAVALAVSSVTFLYTRLLKTAKLRRVIYLSLIAFSLILIGFRQLLDVQSMNWLSIPGLYVFIEIMGILLIIQLWTFANEIFNAREAKRLFGLIGGGAVLANLYSFPIREMLERVGVNNLLYVCMFSLLVCLIIVVYLGKKYKATGQLQASRTAKAIEREERVRTQSPKQRIFALLQREILIVTVIGMLVVTFVDYQFKITLQHHYSGRDMADFQLALYGWGGFAACIIQFLITPKLMEKYGVGALFVLPGLLMFGAMFSLSTALATGAVLSIPRIRMVGATLMKGAEAFTRYTVYETTFRLVYKPLPLKIMRQAQAKADGIARPISQGVAGLLFLAADHFLAVTQPERISFLSIPIILLLLLWFYYITTIKRSYVEGLLVATDQRTIGDDLVPDDSRPQKLRTVIERAFQSKDPERVLHALEVLPQTEWPERFEMLQPLRLHPNPAVRKEALRQLSDSGNRRFAVAVRQSLTDADTEVIAQATETYCALERERAVPQILRLLDHEDVRVQAAAIAGMIRHGGLEGVLEATSRLKDMLQSPEESVRVQAALVLGYTEVHSFYPSLFALIADPSPEVRAAAAKAVGAMKIRELLPNLIYLLGDGRTRTAATQALSNFGKEVLPEFAEALRWPQTPATIRRALPWVMAMIGGQKAYDFLIPQLATGDDRLRAAVVRAVLQISHRDEIDIDFGTVSAALHADLQNYYQNLVYKRIASDEFQDELLEGIYQDRCDASLKRAFRLMALIYPRQQIEMVQYNLQSSDSSRRANAVEIIDNICDTETRHYMLPILEATDQEEIVRRGNQFFTLDHPKGRELLERELNDSDPWIIACAVRAMASRQWLKPEILSFALEHSSPIVRQIAVACAFDIESDMAENTCDFLLRDPDPEVSAYTAFRFYGVA